MMRGWRSHALLPALLPLIVAQGGCRGSSERVSAKSETAPPGIGDAGSGSAVAAATAPPLVLGLPSATAYDYRQGPGEPAFKKARNAEAAGTWSEVVARCREALAADPSHLDASYLLAVALAKTGASPLDVLAPLTVAVAADVAKWGEAALVQPALLPVLATEPGIAWKAQITDARTRFGAILGSALFVTSKRGLFAVELPAMRWHRLTHTGRGVMATFRAPGSHTIVYVTRKKHEISMGTIDLAAAHVYKPIAVPAVGEKLRIATEADRVLVYPGKQWLALAPQGTALALSPDKAAVHASWLDIAGRSVKQMRIAADQIYGDWDEHTLASAVRIGSGKRVVTVPSPGLIDGATATWSPDHTQLAFVAQLGDECTPNEPTTAAYLVPAAAGAPRELVRAKAGIALEWVSDHTLAIANDHGVDLLEVLGTSLPVPGADGLVTPRRLPTCAPAEPAPVDEEPSELE